MYHRPAAVAVLLLLSSICYAQSSFTNFETPHVHPLDMTSDGARLLAVNTADNRLEVFDLNAGSDPADPDSIPVSPAVTAPSIPVWFAQ